MKLDPYGGRDHIGPESARTYGFGEFYRGLW
jgi:hypothetical protein